MTLSARALSFLVLALPMAAAAQQVLPGALETIALPDVDPGVEERAMAVVGADVDGDGRQDLVAYALPAQLVVYRQQADGSLAPAEVHPLPAAGSYGHVAGLAAGDLDGDGRDDLVLSESTSLYVLLARADGGWTLQTLETTGTEGQLEPMLADLDRDGHLDIVASSRNTCRTGSTSAPRPRCISAMAPAACGCAACSRWAACSCTTPRWRTSTATSCTTS